MLREPRNYDTVDGRIVCTRAHADGACTPVSGDEGVKKKKMARMTVVRVRTMYCVYIVLF